MSRKMQHVIGREHQMPKHVGSRSFVRAEQPYHFDLVVAQIPVNAVEALEQCRHFLSLGLRARERRIIGRIGDDENVELAPGRRRGLRRRRKGRAQLSGEAAAGAKERVRIKWRLVIFR